MALKRLTDGVNTVDFSPQAGYVEPGVADIVRHRSRSGKGYSYKFYSGKIRDEVPVQIVVIADAEQINTWFENNTELTYTQDLVHASSVTKTVHIVNSDVPLHPVGRWKTRYEGTLIVEEV